MKRNYKLWVYFALLVIWMGLIFYFSAQNATASKGQSTSMVNLIASILSRHIGISLHILEKLIRKSAHFFLYFMLGIFAANSLGRLNKVNFWIVLAFCVLYASSDEVHQLFVAGRSGEIRDVLIDSCGSLLGIGVFSGFRKLLNKNAPSTNE